MTRTDASELTIDAVTAVVQRRCEPSSLAVSRQLYREDGKPAQKRDDRSESGSAAESILRTALAPRCDWGALGDTVPPTWHRKPQLRRQTK
jgi:hypothetical protein